MSQLFLDSSVILAASGNSQGGSSKIFELALKGRVVLFTSRLAIMEAERNIREKLPLAAFTRFQLVFATYPLTIVNEPSEVFEKKVGKFIYRKDAAILAAAINSKTDYLLTFNRKHFFTQKVETFALKHHLKISTPGEFIMEEKMF